MGELPHIFKEGKAILTRMLQTRVFWRKKEFTEA
jgi:hypothetical protein